MLDNAAKQSLRESLIEYLAGKPDYSFSVSTLTRSIKKRNLVDFPFSEADTAEALALLSGLGLVKDIMPKLGSIKEYQATADGVLFHERNGK
ncbi:MAG TPA: hypothetical protein PKE26_11010 [Kiritimatiellia bacterium]|nr:hypothetical protein [Kiritimatiellia bacterium]HMO99628.1 hypothetical protein [Kiritimatiellia bacterium]HMP97125.1 hypothetical protein [Kiritimatiellia bacterium]